jgi:hypothetical protein
MTGRVESMGSLRDRLIRAFQTGIVTATQSGVRMVCNLATVSRLVSTILNDEPILKLLGWMTGHGTINSFQGQTILIR